MIYQGPFLLFLYVVIGEIIPNVICRTSAAFEGVSFGLQVLEFITTLYCVLGLLRFFMRLYQELKGAGALFMVISFKATVFLVIHQQILMMILTFSKVVPPTEYMNAVDFQYGIPEFMIVCEMFLFSFWYLFAFSAAPYRLQLMGKDFEIPHRPQRPDASIGAYLNDWLNPIDIIKGILEAIKLAAILARGRKRFDYTGGLQKSHEDYALLEAAAKPGESSPNWRP